MPLLSIESLAGLTSLPPLPFSVETPDGTRQVEQVLRWLPGKRLVVQVAVGEESEPRVAKLFFGTKHERDYLRELRGCEGFVQSEIATPALLTQVSGGNASLLEWCYLDGAASFEMCWQQADEPVRKVLYQQLLALVAKLHNKGVIQQDFHLDNLLFQNGQLYLIDGGGVNVLDRPATVEEAQDNLALVLAVLYPIFDRWLDLGEMTYRSASTLPLPERLDLASKVQAKRKWRERFLKKVFRTCTAFIAEKSVSHYQVVRRSLDSGELRALLADPDRAIDEGEILKSGHSATVARVNVGERQWIIKRYNIKSRGHLVARSLKPTRAAASWYNGHLLEFLGVATAAPVAFKENRIGPFRGRSYLVAEVCAGCHTARYFSEDSKSQAQWPQVIERLELLLYGLYRAGVSHGDLKAQNILIEHDRPVLIDLDGLRSWRDRGSFQKAFKRDLQRFERSWKELENAQAGTLFQPLLERFRKLMQQEVNDGNR